MVHIRSEEEVGKIRKSAAILVQSFVEIASVIKPGITTGKLDEIAERVIRGQGGIPAFKGYRGFPATLCTSVNEEVVHGIPGKRKLQEGEIVSIDMGVELNGYFSDAAKTFKIGKVSAEDEKLIEITKKSLFRGIKKCRAGNRISDVSSAIQRCVEKQGFSVVRELVGHGIGTELHEEPQVPNYGSPGKGIKIEPGMVFAIEPMVNVKKHAVKFLDDGWTVVTRDGSKSAHFEHDIAVTKGKPEILTLDLEKIGE